MTLTIRLFDDEENQREGWADDISQVLSDRDVDVGAMPPAEFRESVTNLEQRQREARQEDGAAADADNPLDAVDILLIDFDLIDVAYGDDERQAGGNETGERIAYLARCFSRCRYIVALNQFHRSRTFDLTLRGHLESYADLNLFSDDISSEALWFGRSDSGFRPWYWPRLFGEPSRMETLTTRVSANRDELLVAELGLDQERVRPHLSPEHLAPVGGEQRAENRSLLEVATESPIGLQAKDERFEETALSRIAASRLSKWVTRTLAPGQNIVIDAPHLALRYPSLVVRGTDLSVLTDLSKEPHELPFDHGILDDHVGPVTWAGRPCWWLPGLRTDDRIQEVKEPWKRRQLDKVFCEDTSRFVPEDEAQDYEADVPSEFRERYVEKLDDELVDYAPIDWLLRA